jgi:Spy/CpxP family protein refolding chaperone
MHDSAAGPRRRAEESDMERRVLRVVAWACAALLAVGAAGAQGIGGGERMRGPGMQPGWPGGAGQWWKNPEMVEALGLDQATRDRIDDEAYRSQQALIALRADVERQNLDLQRLLESQEGPVDLRAVEQQVDRFVKARGQVMTEEIMLRARIMSLLTPDQRARLEELFEARRREFRDRALQRREGPPRRPVEGDEPPPPPDEVP